MTNDPFNETDESFVLVDECVTSTGPARARAAANLSRLGVWRRGSIRTRGSLRVPAEDRFADESMAERLALALDDTDPAARGQVALAVGEWGGENSVACLAKQLDNDENEDVRLFSVAALKLIGGDRSAEALATAAQRSTEAVREAALLAIEELATGGGLTDMDFPMSLRSESWRPVSRSQVGTRGAVRVRGAARFTLPLVKALESVGSDLSLPAYLRRKAEEVIELLQ